MNFESADPLTDSMDVRFHFAQPFLVFTDENECLTFFADDLFESLLGVGDGRFERFDFSPSLLFVWLLFGSDAFALRS